MNLDNKIDVIVVGAGPSGIACAVTAARAGHKVLVIEKAANFGVKNMFGGAVYLESIKKLFPESYMQAPYERFIVNHNYTILNDENALNVSYKNNTEKIPSAAIVTRFAFDSWLAECARNEGVFFALNTLVVDLITENNKIIGVKTERENVYASVVVLAEGFNSLLANKAGIKEKIKPKSAILAVKEVLRFSTAEIEKRFHLKDKEGALFEFIGGLHNENDPDIPMGMGFLYTYKNAVSIGVGVSMESLSENKIKPYEYLNRLKNNEFIKPLIEGGELVEYSAHSIPEGGYNELPELYKDGLLLVGDCANLVDSIHFEGTNLAIESGILAGETIDNAIKNNDFSKNSLKEYKKKLYNSFVVKDLKTYKSVIQTLLKRRKSVFSFYPKKIDEFFTLFTRTENRGKKQGYQKFIISFFKDRSLKELISDVISFVKCIFEAII